MSDSPAGWVRLQNALGPRSLVSCRLVEEFGSAEKIFEAGRDAWFETGLLSQKQCERLQKSDPAQAEKIVEMCYRQHITLLTPDSPDYPKLLPEQPDYPIVLYAQGDMDALRYPVMVAMVGTRGATAGGRDTARRFAAALAYEEAVVVSGGAVGIDAASHEGALAVNGRTILVMGCGHGCAYLSENEELRRRVSRNGLLLSEYPPGTEPTRFSFPARNRIIAAMCQCTIVVEASDKSGSLITASYALQRGHTVFVVPNTVTESWMCGGDALLSQFGVRPADSPEDVLQLLRIVLPASMRKNGSYPQMFAKICRMPPITQRRNAQPWLLPEDGYASPAPDSNALPPAKGQPAPQEQAACQEPAEAPEKPDWLQGDVLCVYELVQREKRISLDDIIKKIQLAPPVILAAVSKLELYGFISRAFGFILIPS